MTLDVQAGIGHWGHAVDGDERGEDGARWSDEDGEVGAVAWPGRRDRKD
jgi:hypothetical protein